MILMRNRLSGLCKMSDLSGSFTQIVDDLFQFICLREMCHMIIYPSLLLILACKIVIKLFPCASSL